MKFRMNYRTTCVALGLCITLVHSAAPPGQIDQKATEETTAVLSSDAPAHAAADPTATSATTSAAKATSTPAAKKTGAATAKNLPKFEIGDAVMMPAFPKEQTKDLGETSPGNFIFKCGYVIDTGTESPVLTVRWYYKMTFPKDGEVRSRSLGRKKDFLSSRRDTEWVRVVWPKDRVGNPTIKRMFTHDAYKRSRPRRRRLAHREYCTGTCTHRDSPVLIRLLEDIKRANERANRRRR